ncbi:MAG: hypothetical protein WCJ14_06575 [Verrucomicrobiota bacterium]
MHLPTPQFSRLVTILAFDLTNPALDSMILAWDHIAARFLNRLGPDSLVAGKIESIRLLAIHDSVQAIFDSGSGCIYNGASAGHSLDAALAATAQASHDILAAVFESPEDRADLDDALEESLWLVADERQRAAGAATGAESAATYAGSFAPLALADRGSAAPGAAKRRATHSDWSRPPRRPVLRLATNPHWSLDWQRSA